MAFTAKKKVLVIGEHQSTLNLNMPLRSAIYYGRTMERLVPQRDIYKSKRILIPTPEFYVFYNGTQKQPAERILKLSDAFLEKTDSPMLQLKVRMININPSAGHPILQKCNEPVPCGRDHDRFHTGLWVGGDEYAVWRIQFRGCHGGLEGRGLWTRV